MERRAVIKGLATLGALAILPGKKVTGNNASHKLHFIGLGFAGRNRNEYALRKRNDLMKYRNVRFFDNNEVLEKYGQCRISEDFAHSDEEIIRIIEKEIPNLRS